MTEPKGIMSRLSRLLGKNPEEHAAPHIGLFGKHPAWGDFVHEDAAANMKSGLLGSCRGPLDAAIRRNIDEGRWRNLKDTQRLDWTDGGDGHGLIWKVGNEWLVGRLWPSHDSVDRAEWPMAILAPVSVRVLEPEMTTRVEAWLGNLKREVIAATTQQEVHACTHRAVETLTELFGEAPGGTDPALPPREIADLLSRPELDEVGLARLLYYLDINLAEFRPAKAKSSSASRASQPPSAQLRVPSSGSSDFRLAIAWIRFLLAGVDPKTSIMALVPDHQDWIDLSIGDLTPASLFGLKVNASGEPLTTQIPFEFPEGFSVKSAAFVESCRNGLPPTFPTA